MNLAQFKRKLQPGVVLKNTGRAHKPELIGSLVTVKRNTSEGLQLIRGRETFYMAWPPPWCFKGDGDSFTIFDDNARILTSYQIIPPISTESMPPSAVIPDSSPEAR
jgi:hypothetical protein